MIFDKDGSISIITQEKASIVELVKKLDVLYNRFKNDNVIICLTSLKPIALSDLVEFILVISLCFPETKSYAICVIIIMLVVFLLVHFYMLSGEKASAGVPKWILILRIPLQFGLMYWAWWYLEVNP